MRTGLVQRREVMMGVGYGRRRGFGGSGEEDVILEGGRSGGIVLGGVGRFNQVLERGT